MRFLFAFVLASCAAVPPNVPQGNNCGVIAGGDWDTKQLYSDQAAIIADQMSKALDATTTVSAPGLQDIMQNCRSLVGYKVYTKKQFSWPDPYGRGFSVAGLTYCGSKIMIIGTPADGNWKKSAFVHQFFHAFQNCQANPPNDIGSDSDHAGWYRYGIYEAIERVTK